jgi:hypothetical protein
MIGEEEAPHTVPLTHWNRSNKGPLLSLECDKKKTSDSHKAFIESIPGPPPGELNYKSNLSWYLNPFDVSLVKRLHIP